MSENIILRDEAKKIILEKIAENVDFRSLRKSLPGFSRRAIKLLVLEVMTEEKISEVPFEGMMRQRQKRPQPLPVTSEGMVDITSLLAQKNYLPENCSVRFFVGQKKITLTVFEKRP